MKGDYNRQGHYLTDNQGDGNWSTEWPGGADDQNYHGASGSQTGYDYEADYENYIVEDGEGWPCCSSCQQYVAEDEDEYRDNDTDTDEEVQAAATMTQQELLQYLGDDMPNANYDDLKVGIPVGKAKVQILCK